jgi:hypothetical protein
MQVVLQSLAKQRGITEALTSDHDFEQSGYQALLTS